MSAPPIPPDDDRVQVWNQAVLAAYAAHSEGRWLEAQQGYLELLQLRPESAQLWYNLGLLAYAQHDVSLALEEFARADSLAPGDPDTLFNLALCQKEVGECAAAVATYGRLLALQPDHVDGLYNLGGCHRALKEENQAMVCYLAVLELQPGYLPAAKNLAYLLHRAGATDEAIGYYRQVLAGHPEDASVRFLLAALLGEPLDQAPDAYVRDFFDAYASSFEQSLVEELGYDTPRQLYGCLCRSLTDAPVFAHGLDLGCGTGLSGLGFSDAVEQLDGVDLSAKMVRQAATKGCYAQLSVDSLLHYLATTSSTYDLFLATDVFIYVGELATVFQAARAVARPGALFCFSTERSTEAGCCLQTTGRFAYTPEYIRAAAEAAGWTVLTEEASSLRREGDHRLAGELWICRLKSCTT